MPNEPMKLVRVTIDVELEGTVKDLADKIASRANTIQGVWKAYETKIEEIGVVLDKTNDRATDFIETVKESEAMEKFEEGFAQVQAEVAERQADTRSWFARTWAKVKGWFQ